MAAYGDLPTIKAMLGLTDASQDTRLSTLNEALSRLLDGELGRTYGGEAATAETRTVWQDAGLTMLALPTPLRSLTSIAIDGTWDGTDWTDPTTLAADTYRARPADADGNIWAIDLYESTATEYRVTGVWADQVQAAPAAIVEAVNVMVTRAYKRDEAGAGGDVIGPTEFGQAAPQGIMTDDRVKQAIAQYRLRERVL